MSLTFKIRVIQHSRFVIYPKDKNESCQLTGRNSIRFDTTDSEVSFLITHFKVNGSAVPTSVTKVIENNKVRSSYSIPLSGQDSYKVELDIEKEYSLKHDNIIGMMKDYLIHDFNLKVLLKGEIGIEFYPVGTLKKFTRAKVKSPAYQEYDYRGIIYPKQGYLLFVKPNYSF